MRYLLLPALLFCQLACATGSAPPAVLSELRRTGIPIDAVAIDVRAAEGGKPLLAVNPARAFKPASVMKLLTTHVALSVMGPEHRWVTAVHLDGELREGVLRGNLVLRGGGDPKLVIEDLTELISRIRAAGLREIRGDLVIDDGLFDLAADRSAPIDGDASQPYNVGPHAALMNFKAT